jgi:hypothetical protein
MSAAGPSSSGRSHWQVSVSHRAPALIAVTFVMCALSARAQDLSSPDLRPVTLTGSIVTSAENYSIPGLDTHRPANTARMYFNPTLTLYGVQLPFSVVLSTNERSYNQPFNQFGVSPRYKSVTAHAGYRSLRFSEFTLSDAVILGGGAEFDGEWLRAGAIYGRFRRAIGEDTTRGIRAVYKRMGYAANVGLGSRQNGIDFNFVHAWDDSTSIGRTPLQTTVLPEENLTIGTTGRISLVGNRLAIDGELAGSFLTRDLYQPAVENADVVSVTDGIYDTRLSTRLTTALRIGAAWNEQTWSLRTEYARVEPEFESAGAQYTMNDREDITIAPNLRLADGAFRVGGSVGFRSDNLLEDRAYTTRRVIGSANVNWMPSQTFGLDANYSNYSMANASAGLVLNDTSRVENVSESYSIAPRLSFATADMQHFVMLFATRQLFTDRNVLTGANSDNDVLTILLSWTGSLQSGLGLQGSLQFTEVHTAFVTNIIRGITAGVSHPFFENALMADLSYTLNLTQSGSASDTDMQHLLTLAARWRISGADALDLRFQYNSYDASDIARRSYSGTTTRLQYTRAFAFGTN